MPCILCAAPAVAWADVDTPVCAGCLAAEDETPEQLRQRLASLWADMLREPSDGGC